MSHRSTVRGRFARNAVLALAPAALAVTLAAAPAVAAPADVVPAALAAPGAAPGGPCADDTGITVVVDLTDLGGEVETGCAPDAATGTEALQQAGFTDTRDASGMICAIDALPDPCPAEFAGSYWSYWHADADGTWEAWMEGSDTAVPEPGDVEGWRYSDGAEGPTVSPAEAVAASAADDSATEDAPEDEATEAGDAADDGTVAAPAEGQPQGADRGPLVAAAAAVAVLAALAVLLSRRRRDPAGPAGQD